MNNIKLAIVLAMAVALGPFTFDTYLPAFPNLAQAMGVGINDIALSVTVYIFGLALGQLVGGPLSDRWGRAKIMVTGLVIFFLASIILAFSSTLDQLLFWRVIQAFGGGWAAVSVPAIVRDRTEGKETAKLFSLIALMMIIAPAIAPSIGSIILTVASWRGIFIFLAIYAVLILILSKFYIFSNPVAPAPSKIKATFFSGYIAVLKHKTALYHIFLQGFAFSIIMIFLTHASFIYQQWFGVSNFTFSLLFACNIVMMAILNITSQILLRWWSSLRILFLAVVFQAAAVVALILAGFLHPSIYFIVPGLMVGVGTIGVISPNNQSCYLQFFKESSATAAALMGAMQLAISGCMSALSVFFADGTLRSITLAMGICVFICFLLAWRVLFLETPNTELNS